MSCQNIYVFNAICYVYFLSAYIYVYIYIYIYIYILYIYIAVIIKYKMHIVFVTWFITLTKSACVCACVRACIIVMLKVFFISLLKLVKFWWGDGLHGNPEHRTRERGAAARSFWKSRGGGELPVTHSCFLSSLSHFDVHFVQIFIRCIRMIC